MTESDLPATTPVRTASVLIVEDDAETRGMLAQILQMHGMETLEAGDGQEAVALAFEWRPDAVVVDLGLPIMDGIAVARAISADRATAGTPIVAITGMLSEQLRRAALEAGCVAYIQKPFSPLALVDELKRWLPAGSWSTAGL